MNDRRRKELQEVLDAMLVLKERLEVLRDEERDAFEALPESLQQTSRGQASEAAADALEAAIETVEELENSLQQAME